MVKVTDIKHARVLREVVASLKRAGWNVHRPLVSPNGLGGPTVYLYDAETRFRQSIVYPSGALKAIAQHPDTLKATFEDSCILLDALLGQLSGRGASEFPLGEVQTLLKIAAGAYLLGTKIFGVSRTDGEALHYLVVRYPHTVGDGYFLRPSRVMTGKVLTPEEVEQCALNLLTAANVPHAEQPVGIQGPTPPTQDSWGSSGASPRGAGPRPRR